MSELTEMEAPVALRVAIADPGSILERRTNETVARWSARAVLASAWYAERIAEARREGAAEALEAVADVVDSGPTFPLPPSVISALILERVTELRGDA